MRLFPSVKERAGRQQGSRGQVNCMNTLAGSGSPRVLWAALPAVLEALTVHMDQLISADVPPVLQQHLTKVFVESHKFSMSLARM